MKKSITENKNMTFDDIIKLYIYRPYNDVLKIMVDDDERIHIKGDTWIVILDHNTGDFSFKGELHKYYDIDMIESIRDCFGDIYSVFNLKYDSIPRDTWITIEDEEDTSGKKTSYAIQFEDEDKKKRMLQRKKEYYWAHKEQINKRQREYYKKRNQVS